MRVGVTKDIGVLGIGIREAGVLNIFCSLDAFADPLPSLIAVTETLSHLEMWTLADLNRYMTFILKIRMFV